MADRIIEARFALAALNTIKGLIDTGSNVYSAWMQRRQALALEVPPGATMDVNTPIPISAAPPLRIDKRSIVTILIMLALT